MNYSTVEDVAMVVSMMITTPKHFSAFAINVWHEVGRNQKILNMLRGIAYCETRAEARAEFEKIVACERLFEGSDVRSKFINTLYMEMNNEVETSGNPYILPISEDDINGFAEQLNLAFKENREILIKSIHDTLDSLPWAIGSDYKEFEDVCIISKSYIHPTRISHMKSHYMEAMIALLKDYGHYVANEIMRLYTCRVNNDK